MKPTHFNLVNFAFIIWAYFNTYSCLCVKVISLEFKGARAQKLGWKVFILKYDLG